MEDETELGLRDKFKVTRPEGNEVKRKSFVLLYEADPAARVALRAYAMATKNGVLAQDLDVILNRIERRPEDYPAIGSEARLNRGVTCKHFEKGDTAVLIIDKKDIDNGHR